MIAGLTAAAGGSAAVEPAARRQPLPGTGLGLLDAVGLAIVIQGPFVQRRGDVLHARAGRELPALVREPAQRGDALVHPAFGGGRMRAKVIADSPDRGSGSESLCGLPTPRTPLEARRLTSRRYLSEYDPD